MRFLESRVDGEGLAVAVDRVIRILKQASEVSMCLREVRLECQGGAVAGGGLIETPKVAKRIGQVGVICSYAGVTSDCLADYFDCQIITASLVGDYTEQMEAVGVAGIGCQALTVK